MNMKDAIDFAENRMHCKMGYPGRYIDGPGGKKEYTQVGFHYQPMDMSISNHAEVAEHLLACTFISYIDRLLILMGPANGKPIMYWRDHGKIRIFQDDKGWFHIESRIHIVGCKDYGDAKMERPKVGHVRLAVSNAKPEVPLLTLKEPA